MLQGRKGLSPQTQRGDKCGAFILGPAGATLAFSARGAYVTLRDCSPSKAGTAHSCCPWPGAGAGCLPLCGAHWPSSVRHRPAAKREVPASLADRCRRSCKGTAVKPELERNSSRRSVAWHGAVRLGGRAAAAGPALRTCPPSRKQRVTAFEPETWPRKYRVKERQTKLQATLSVCALLDIRVFFSPLIVSKKKYCVFGSLCCAWSYFPHILEKQRKRGRGTAFCRRYAFSQEEVDCMHDKSPSHLL